MHAACVNGARGGAVHGRASGNATLVANPVSIASASRFALPRLPGVARADHDLARIAEQDAARAVDDVLAVADVLHREVGAPAGDVRLPVEGRAPHGVAVEFAE